MKILVINPGSTSTKIAVFEDKKPIFVETIRLSNDVTANFNSVLDQTDFRKQQVLDSLKSHGFDVSSFDAVIGRGGIVKPIHAGTYIIDSSLINDLKSYSKEQEHASALGGLIAYGIASQIGKPAYIADPVSVDEFEDLAYISGLKEIKRKSLLHALNVRASLYRYAEEFNKKIENINAVVAHLGGGITVAAIKNGKIVDVNNANEGGPFSPERAGSLPSIDVVNMSYSGKYSRKDLLKMFIKTGGMVSYLGTNDMKQIIDRIEDGETQAKEVFDAMCYQIAKEIGAMATVISGKVDAIIITGGIAYNNEVIEELEMRVGWIGEVIVYPGEFELEALAYAALRVLKGEESPMIYC